MCCFFSAEANSNCIKRSLANLSNIKNSKWFKSCLAWISIILYILDISSDIYVGVDLIYHCHYYYGAIILSVILIPGFIFGFYLWFRAVKKGWSFKVLLFTPFFPYIWNSAYYSIHTLLSSECCSKNWQCKGRRNRNKCFRVRFLYFEIKLVYHSFKFALSTRTFLN